MSDQSFEYWSTLNKFMGLYVKNGCGGPNYYGTAQIFGLDELWGSSTHFNHFNQANIGEGIAITRATWTPRKGNSKSPTLSKKGREQLVVSSFLQTKN